MPEVVAEPRVEVPEELRDLMPDAQPELTLRTPPKKAILMFAGALACIGLGLLLRRWGNQTLGWAVVATGALCLAAMVPFLPSRSFLHLTPDGFSALFGFRRHELRWSDVAGFGVIDVVINGVNMMKLVGYDHSESFVGKRFRRGLSRGMSGMEASLPDTYGLDAHQLAFLMNAWLARHAPAPSNPA